jgi:hypothetical protein
MRENIHHMLTRLIADSAKINRLLALPSKPITTTKRTSNKSKLKMTKKKPNVKYKSSKPVSAKVTTTFRTRSNL